MDTSNRKIESIQYSARKILDVSNLRYGDAGGKSRIEGNNETTKFGREKFRAVHLQKYNSYFSDLNFLITSIYDLNKRNNKRIIIGNFTDDSQN